MITIQINDDQREFSPSVESWISKSINNLRKTGIPICLRVHIKISSINVALTSFGCGGSIGGRPPKLAEGEIINLWNQKGLNGNGFSSGDIISFLNRIKKQV